MTLCLKVKIKGTYGNKEYALHNHRAIGSAEEIPIWIVTNKWKASVHYHDKCPTGADSSTLLESMVLTWKKRKPFVDKSINYLENDLTVC
jgi:hypothetical protein